MTKAFPGSNLSGAKLLDHLRSPHPKDIFSNPTTFFPYPKFSSDAQFHEGKSPSLANEHVFAKFNSPHVIKSQSGSKHLRESHFKSQGKYGPFGNESQGLI